MDEKTKVRTDALRKEIGDLKMAVGNAADRKLDELLHEKRRELSALLKISDPEYNILGKRLREMRESLKLSQSAVAEEVGLKQLAVMNYESGKRTPDAKTLRAFSRLFNCTSDYLLGLSEYKNEGDKAEYDRISGFFADKLSDLDHSSKSKLIFALASFIDAEAKISGYGNDETYIHAYKYLRKISDIIDEYAIFIRSLNATKKYLTEKQDLATQGMDGTFDIITHTASYFFGLREHSDRIKKANEDLMTSLHEATFKDFF